MKQVSFLEPHSRAIRFWHWSSFIVVLLLLFTVFVSKSFLNVISTHDILYQSLRGMGVTLTKEQAWNAAIQLNDRIWVWHTRYGYVLSALFAFRILIEFAQLKKERFFFRVMEAFRQWRRKDHPAEARHYLVVKLIYFLFYGLLAALAGTGLWMAFHTGIKESDPGRFHAVKEIHENAFVALLFFILLHLIGLMRAERRKYKGVVSAMIHGGKEWK